MTELYGRMDEHDGPLVAEHRIPLQKPSIVLTCMFRSTNNVVSRNVYRDVFHTLVQLGRMDHTPEIFLSGPD